VTATCKVRSTHDPWKVARMATYTVRRDRRLINFVSAHQAPLLLTNKHHRYTTSTFQTQSIAEASLYQFTVMSLNHLRITSLTAQELTRKYNHRAALQEKKKEPINHEIVSLFKDLMKSKRSVFVKNWRVLLSMKVWWRWLRRSRGVFPRN
jgi:hypothetical protein